jgi:hypothetical protein
VSGRGVFWALATASLALTPRGAMADYEPTSTSWNAMSYLAVTAREARVDLSFTDRLDWAEVRTDAVLVFVYPETPPDVEQAAAFLADGGRIVVADDHGESDALLSRYGMRKVTQRIAHANFLRGDPDFPVFTARGEHFLFYNIRELGEAVVGNAPVGFEVSAPASPIVTFDDPRVAFAAETRVGDGGLLAIGDASLFINEMLYEHPCKQFVANALRYYCRADPCKAVVVLPRAIHEGRYVPPVRPNEGELSALLRRGAEAANGWLSGLSGALTDTLWARLLAFGAFGLLLSALARVAIPERPLARFGFELPPHGSGSDLDDLARGLATARESADFARPLSALLASFAATVELADPELVSTPAQRESFSSALLLRNRPPESERAAVRQALLNVLGLFHTVRAQAGHARISYSQFSRAYADVATIRRWLRAG